VKKKLYHSAAWLKLQRSKGRSITDIAKECGVSAQIINVYLKKHGLK
jgi:DNA-binding transcriptional regulator LsrR (DeoR family)